MKNVSKVTFKLVPQMRRDFCLVSELQAYEFSGSVSILIGEERILFIRKLYPLACFHRYVPPFLNP